MIKYLSTAILLFTFLSFGYAQEYTSTDSKAEKAYENALNAFDQRNYNMALSFVGEALERDKNFIEAYLLRFEIYAEQGQIEDAEVALESAVTINPDFFPNAWFFLGALEMKQGKYKEARTHFERFKEYANINPEMVEKANFELANCEFAIKAMKNPVPFEPINMGPGVNTDAPEYYPGVSADNQMLIFTRLDKDPNSFQGKNENLYVSRNLEGAWLPGVRIGEVNTEYNEGAPTISADGRTMVFTACELMDEYGGGRTGFGSCDLFISRKVGNEWGTPVNVGEPVNTAAWETQPSLSADGKVLYFVRGKPTPGGVQNQDIYYSLQRNNGEWAKPRPVSDKINTPGREESVMIHPDGKTLYFSSNGHVGMGGLDLYMSQKDETGIWSTPVNLGYPINTFNEENSLLVAASGEIAYFASDRDGGFGNLDLYKFDLHEAARPTAVTYAKGIVRDAKTGSPVKAAIRLYDVDLQNVAIAIESDEKDGTFLLALPTGRTYALGVVAEGYLYHSETFELTSEKADQAFALEVDLQSVEEGSAIVLKNVFFDVDESSLKKQSTPELQELGDFLRQNPTVFIELSGHTDNQGAADYNKTLSEARAKSVKDYLVTMEGIVEPRISIRGVGADEPIASNETEEGRAMNRRTEFRITEKR
jgi:outer membrane protein OmpA-like peptidoglycan-associated protein/Tol biopolymer transport system component